MSTDWNDYTYETDVFRYNYKQLIALRITTLAVSSVSLISSVFIIAVYVYMLLRHKKKVNRVSLRCVFLCSLVDTLNSILHITIMNKLGGTTYCKSASVILITTNILSASLLTIVGLNLVLIFVLKVSQTDLLEKFYYPGVLIYSIVGTIVPIYQEATNVLEHVDQYSCWHFIYIQDRTYNIFSWMWFYGFLFFINIIAVICSVMAMAKLLHEHSVFDRSMGKITKNSLSSSSQSNERVKQNQNNMFTKVVLRCIIYPLVPFLANIFGFILQMVITTSDKNPGFSLTMLDVIFSCIEGFFVAIVFFTDPAVTSLFKSNFKSSCEKYVHQYTLVDTSTYDNIQRKFLPSHLYQNQHLSVSTTIYCYNATDDQSSFEKMSEKKQQKRIPIRCLRVELNSNKTSHDDSHSKSVLNVATELNLMHNDTASEPSVPPHSKFKYVYIPYKYPRLATCHYWFLRCLGVKPKPIIQEENSGSFSSIISSNINMLLVPKPKNAVLIDTV